MTMHPQPLTLKQLIQLIYRQSPEPTQLEITILPDRIQDDDNDDDDDDDDDGNDDNYDDSDYYYLKDGIHLGIHAPNVPHLARSFRHEYYSLRTDFKKKSVMKYNYKHRNDGDGDVNDGDVNDGDDAAYENNNSDAAFVELQTRLWDATTCLVLLCPDHATAWSDRKRILLHRQRQSKSSQSSQRRGGGPIIELWQEEIQFLNLLFTQHSKAPNAWSHRKWVSKQIFTEIQNNICNQKQHDQHETNDAEVGVAVFNANFDLSKITAKNNETNENEINEEDDKIDKNVEINEITISNQESNKMTAMIISQWTQNELDICTSIAEKYAKNYYAWTHRRFVIDSLIQLKLDVTQKRHVSSLPLLEEQQKQQDDDDCYFDFDSNNDKYPHLWHILQSEYEFILSWIMRHVSDHSAVHYGGEILRLMIFLRCREVGGHFWNSDDDNDATTAIGGRSGNFYHVYICRYFGLHTSSMSNQSGPEKDRDASYDQNRQNQQNNNITDQGMEGSKYDKWIIDLIQESLIKSLAFIQKYPSNEVVWIWRRICFQIYMDYALGVVKRVATEKLQEEVKESVCNDNNEEQIEQYTVSYDCEKMIQKDIESFVVNDDLTMEDEYDQRQYKLYSTTYILWLLEHLQRHNQIEASETSVTEKQSRNSATKWQELHSGLINDLAGNVSTSSGSYTTSNNNMWTIKLYEGKSITSSS